MSEVIAVVNRLAGLGVRLHLKDGKLATRAAAGAITPEVAELIKSRRDQLLAFLRQREQAAAQRTEAIPAATGDRHVLSSAQKRLWLVDRSGAAGASYNMPAALRIDGALDREALVAALGAIVERHRILRTVYLEREGEPECVVRSAACFEVTRVSLAGRDPAAQEAALQDLVADECARPFALDTDLMLRATLAELADTRHVLLLTMHHIASDGWSMGILVDEFVRLYEANKNGGAAPLPPLAVQYGDYAAWQNGLQRGGMLAGQREYWMQRLAGALHLHQLPTDRPRPARQSFAGAVKTCMIGAEDSAGLLELCRQTGTTPFVALQLAFAILLARWSNENDILFGTPIANRIRPELEGLIGFFVNTLVLRNRIDPERPFRALLADAAPAVARDYDHQSLPFDALVDALKPARSNSHPPLVQIMFAMQNNARKAVQIDGLSLEPLGMAYDTAKFDLTLNVAEHQGGLATSWEFCTALFDAGTVERMAGHFQALVREIGLRPDAPVRELDMLGAAERRHLLHVLNDKRRAYPDASIPEVFRAQAARHGERIALREGAATLSYAQLDARVRTLAAHLRAHGLGDEEPVGIYLDRGIDMVVAMLAVLDAGGAYVPLDLSMPAERVASVVVDAGCRLILCSARRRAGLDGLGCGTIEVDAVAETGGRVDPAPAPHGNRRLAYVMYTSGSTGKPKGALIEQRGVLRLVCDPGYVRIGAGDTLAQASNSAFDAATFEIWGALLNGACLAFIDNATLMDPERLEAAFARDRISVLWMTAALFAQTASLRPGIFANLEYVLFGGDVVNPQLVERVLRAGKPAHLLNGYGPTECTTFATTFEVTAPSAAVYPIGAPIGNTRCYVLGRCGELLPYGAVGELYIGGDGVARGYLNRPELSAEKFLLDPYADGRLYRTGDAVRWLPDGQLQFMARMDQQVKIRGFRVELGEIEHALLAQASVAQACVVDLDDETRGKFLVAYAVLEAGVDAQGEAGRLKAELARSLPAYMVPSAVVLLDALPLNANGKIARSELPRPQLEAQEAASADQSESALERCLAQAWGETLGLAAVGAAANFFELGGNSLLMMRLCGKLRECMGIEVPFAEFIGLPTIRQQAAWLAGQGAGTASTAIPRRAPAPDYPLSFAQQRLWFEALLGNAAGYNLPVAMRLDGELDADALAQAIERVVEKHAVLRSRYFSQAGLGRQRIAPMAPGLVERIDLAGCPDPDGACSKALLDTVATPFNLEHGPVFRALLYRLGERAHVLLLNMHHIVADGWSMRVLFDEVTGLYARIVGGEPDARPEALPVQYTDYACWQRDNEGDQADERALAFWTEALSFVPALPLMPTDGARYAAPSYPLGTLAFAIPADLTAALKRVAAAHDASLFMVLMAAYGFVIADYNRQEKVLIGTDIAGRDHAETEKVVGLFVNQLGIVAHTAAGARFSDLLAGVRSHTLAAYRNQHVPVEKVVAALRLERGLSQHPLFQTKLVLQNFPASQGGSMPAIERTSVALGTRHCKLDLMLTVSEGDGVLQADWEFNADYFREPTIRRLEANLMTTLRRVATDAAAALDVLRADFDRVQRERLQSLRGRLAGATRVRQATPLVSTPESEGSEA